MQLSPLRIAGVVVVAWLSACATAPGITLVSMEPTALLDPRGADCLVLVDGEGRRSAKARVAAMVVDEARLGFFRADNRSASGVELVLVGDVANVVGSDVAPRDDELWVRIDVLSWTAEAIKMELDDDSSLSDAPGIRGRADLQFTVANAASQVLVREQEVRGVVDRALPEGQRVDIEALREDVIAEAARVAVTDFLATITPQRRSQFLAFDDGDTGQKAIITDTTSTLASLEKRLRRYVANNKGNAIAHFNLAVVLDAQSRFEEALIEQDRGLDIVSREGFFDARSDTIRRRDVWERMYGPRPTPVVVDDGTPSPVIAVPPTPMPAAPTPTTMSAEPLVAPVGATEPTWP